MAKIFFNRLILGSITYADIPYRYQAQVLAIGREWLNSGRMSKEQFDHLFNEYGE